jgi:hypothetical protein
MLPPGRTSTGLRARVERCLAARRVSASPTLRGRAESTGSARRRRARGDDVEWSPALDHLILLNNNGWARVEFTQAARRNSIGKSRVLQVLVDPVVVHRIVEEHDPRVRLLILVEGDTGRALEVTAVRTDRESLVIQTMDPRQKYRALYEEGKRS